MPENQVFTDEQIEEIISIFTQHMGHRQYIGARYVPIFGRKGETTIEWDNSAPYEPLTIVLYQGNSYTSRQYVPTGVDISNGEFWALTGNYNAQIEAYRQEVLAFEERIAANEEAIADEAQAREDADTGLAGDIANEAQAREDADTGLAEDIADEAQAREALALAIGGEIDKTMLNAINMQNTRPVIREILDVDSNQYSSQSIAAFEANGNEIVVIYMMYDNNQPGKLISYLNGTKVSTVAASMGHGASMCYHDGYVYIPDNYSTHMLYKYPIDNNGNIGSPTVAFNFGGGHICIAQGRFFGIDETHIIEYDPTTGEVLSTIVTQFKYADIINGTGQSASAFVYNGKIYFAYMFSFPNFITIVDVSGNFIGSLDMPDVSGFISLYELEQAHILENGDFFILANDNGTATYAASTCVVAKGNIYSKQMNSYMDYMTNSAAPIIIEAYFNTYAYMFPKVANIGAITATNGIKVTFAQDIQTILNCLPNARNGSILIQSNGNLSTNGIYLDGFNGVLALNDHYLTFIDLRNCSCEVLNSSTHLNHSGPETARISLHNCPLYVSRYNFTAPGALKAENSCMIIPSASNTYVNSSGSSIIINPSV